MGKDIVVSSHYLPHSGGTKFYEIIEIANAGAKRFVEVRRWGKISHALGAGGQIQILEHKSAGAMADSARKQMNAKIKGGYSRQPGKFGFHRYGGSTYNETQVLSLLPDHYSTSAERADIVEKAAIDPSGKVEKSMDNDGFVKPEEEAGPEPDRGEHWGSW
ncbi:WGR domain-containing protein [Paraburkholderia sp.]|uniref:WGR domain-containing protein n=1 Tax=Paraburkholderia sp. TaxID=1926495 RepID=UPI0039E31028